MMTPYHKAVAIFDEHLAQFSVAAEKSLNVPLLHPIGQASDVYPGTHIIRTESVEVKNSSVSTDQNKPRKSTEATCNIKR